MPRIDHNVLKGDTYESVEHGFPSYGWIELGDHYLNNFSPIGYLSANVISVELESIVPERVYHVGVYVIRFYLANVGIMKEVFQLLASILFNLSSELASANLP